MVAGVNPITEYNVSSSKARQENIQNTLKMSKDAVSNNIEDNSVVKLLSGSGTEDSSKTDALLLIPFLSVIDKFIDKKIGAEGDKGLFSKIAKLGDKLSNALHLEKFISEENSGKLANFLKNNRFTKYFTNDYKAIAISPLAKGQTLLEKYTNELSSYTEKLITSPNVTAFRFNPELMKELIESGNFTDDTINFLKQVGPLAQDITPEFLDDVAVSLKELASKSSGASILQSEQQLIKNLLDNIDLYKTGANTITQENLASQIASTLGKFKGDKIKQLLDSHSISLSQETKDILSSVSEKKFTQEQILNAIDDLAKNGINVDTKGKLSQLRNKFNAASLKLGDTIVGKNFAKGALKTKDLITYGGGLLNLYFMASAIVNAVKATKEAPEGEKKSTFMHVLSEQYLGILFFQPSMNIMYKLGGNKYRGMSVEGRNALKELVKNTNANRNLTKEGLKIANIQKDLLLRGVSKDKVEELAGKGLKEVKNMAKTLKKEGTKLPLWERPLKFMGRVLSMGLDTMKKHKYIKLPKIGEVKLPKPTLKGFAGGLGRALLIFMVIQPLIQKPVTKLFHKIFGEPKAYLEKQKQAGNKTQTSPAGEQNSTGETNLLRKYENQMNNQTVQPSASSPLTEEAPADEIPALNIFNKDKDEKESRYIPSIDVDISYAEDNAKAVDERVNQLLKETDGLIKSAKKRIS